MSNTFMSTAAVCIFCKIATSDIPAQVILQDKHAVAFLDVQPIAPGHMLVVPRTHIDRLSILAADEVGPFFQLAQQALRRIEEGLKPDGVTIGINQGETAGQAVPHLHLHLIPRFAGDGGKSIHSVVKNPPTESLEEVAKKLAS